MSPQAYGPRQFRKRNDHYEKNSELDPDNWDKNLAQKRDRDEDIAKKYNYAAMVTTAVTGAFVSLILSDLIMKTTKKKGQERAVSLSSIGVEVSF